MRYKAVFKVSYRGPNQDGAIIDQAGRHSIEYDEPTNRAAYEEATKPSSETLVHLRSAYMGMTNVEIELMELYRLEPIDISVLKPTISIV